MNRIQLHGVVGEFWGAHAPRVQALAPRQGELSPRRSARDRRPGGHARSSSLPRKLSGQPGPPRRPLPELLNTLGLISGQTLAVAVYGKRSAGATNRCPIHDSFERGSGRYTDFKDVDEVTVVQSFQSTSYRRVTVQRLDTSNAPLPDAKDNSYPAVKEALANSTQPFAAGMREKLGNMQVQAGQGGGAGSLVVRARITKSDPGSQAARYFVSFGAGAVKVGITGEIVDGASNKVLARFTQERRSGFGGFGGGYRDLLDRTLKQIGGDVGGLIRAF